MSMKSFVFIFYLSVAQNILGNIIHELSGNQAYLLTDLIGNKERNGRVQDELDEQSDDIFGDEKSIETRQRSLGDSKHHWRSVFPFLRQDSRIISDLGFSNLMNGTFSDKFEKYESEVNPDNNLIPSNKHEDVYIEEVPDSNDGRGTVETIPLENNENKDIRIGSGYDSRIRNGAGILNDKGLFGFMTKGKVDDFPYYRFVPKSRDANTANDMHKSRNVSPMPIRKRHIFGIKGPIKRYFHSTNFRTDTARDIGLVNKRISSDFGYGSREQIAEKLALDSIKGKAFGMYGPGKRFWLKRSFDGKDAIDVDSGYGSRVQAGSQIANDVVTINDVYGLFGPGRR